MFIKNSEETTGKEYILDKPETPSSFLQFIPATVHQVINSGESIASPTNNDNESNCIIVEKNILTDDVTLNGVDSRKYRPLMRGVIDSITKNDLVLITMIGPTGYYLGPINVSNTPSNTQNNLAGFSNTTGATPKSTTYPYGVQHSRLIKQFKPVLDDPELIAKVYKSPKTGKPVSADIHTDLILEGRHGNSIRVGSRNKFPNIIIDNGRGTNQNEESINDSSIFGMFHKGSILDHFDFTKEFLEGEPYSFKFSDEEIESPSNTIKSTFTSPLGRGLPLEGEEDSDIENTIYNYEGPFSILNSDRIIINARKENLFLAARNHIHIGSGNTLTFSTSQGTIFNSTERFDINAPEIRLGSVDDSTTQPLVLGDTLVNKFQDLCFELDELINQIVSITVPTTQGPSGTPINSAAFTPVQSNIRTLADTIEEALSITNRTT